MLQPEERSVVVGRAVISEDQWEKIVREVPNASKDYALISSKPGTNGTYVTTITVRDTRGRERVVKLD